MRQIRQALRLHLEAGLSYAQIARAVGIGKGTVGKFMLLARAAGVDWSVSQTLSDEQLEARLYRPAVPRARSSSVRASRCSCCGRSTSAGPSKRTNTRASA